jgi:3,4-dihydroxy 2-butanone 4-phosphate synthase/GTP cyclohydrolase II
VGKSAKKVGLKEAFFDFEETLTESGKGRSRIAVGGGERENEGDAARFSRHVHRVSETRLPTDLGEFRLILYESLSEPGSLHFSLLKGDPKRSEAPLVRLHSECLTGESLLSVRCDCGYQLRESMRRVQKEGGIIVYLRQEGRGIGFANKIRAYSLQDRGYDTVDANLLLGFPADQRDYTTGARILEDMGVRRVRLLTNNPDKIAGLEACGIKVEERIPIVAEPRRENELYLAVKKRRLGHLLDAGGCV